VEPDCHQLLYTDFGQLLWTGTVCEVGGALTDASIT
jgi:hypothetical protein